MKPFVTHACLLSLVFLLGQMSSVPLVTITGELRQWHTVTLTLDGPEADERFERSQPVS